jgi:hypothetical protein
LTNAAIIKPANMLLQNAITMGSADIILTNKASGTMQITPKAVSKIPF